MASKNLKYEFLPHTADVKFKAYGKSLEKAFENAAYALTEVMIKPSKVKAAKKKRISVKSEDVKALLYDFLEQFLILADSKGFVLNKVDKIEIKCDKKTGKYSLDAEVIGDTNIESYEIAGHIKAVTYEDMIVAKKGNIYTLQVILDI